MEMTRNIATVGMSSDIGQMDIERMRLSQVTLPLLIANIGRHDVQEKLRTEFLSLNEVEFDRIRTLASNFSLTDELVEAIRKIGAPPSEHRRLQMIASELREKRKLTSTHGSIIHFDGRRRFLYTRLHPMHRL